MSSWPDKPFVSGGGTVPKEDLQSDPEFKKSQVYAAVSSSPTQDLLSHYSSWSRLKQAVVWMIRFMTYLASRVREKPTFKETGPPTAQELDIAERRIIKFVQRQSFPSEFQPDAGDKKRAWNSSKGLERTIPFLRDGLLHEGGRLDRSPLSDEREHPLIHPGDHHITKLLIVHYHFRVGHCGSGMACTALR